MPIRETTMHGSRILGVGERVRIRTDRLDLLPVFDEQLLSTKIGANLIITHEHGPFARIKEWIMPNSTRTVIPLLPDVVYQTQDIRYDVIGEPIKMRKSIHQHWKKRKHLSMTTKRT